MKPGMMFTIIAIVAIILIAGAGMQLGDTTPMVLAPDVAGQALFVCPAADQTWDLMAQSLRPINHYITLAFFGAGCVLAAVWAWQLYILLIKDKFERSAFTKVWQLTKFWFWAAVIMLMLSITPNHFRRVRVDGDNRTWVMCDNNTPGRVPVRATAVHSN